MSILRQLKDIQVQADNLSTNSDVGHFNAFGQYAREIKTYVLAHYKDDFTQKLAEEIPDLDTSKIQVKYAWWIPLIAIFSGGAGFLKDHAAKKEALEIAQTVKAKCASIEFVLRNQA